MSQELGMFTKQKGFDYFSSKAPGENNLEVSLFVLGRNGCGGKHQGQVWDRTAQAPTGWWLWPPSSSLHGFPLGSCLWPCTFSAGSQVCLRGDAVTAAAPVFIRAKALRSTESLSIKEGSDLAGPAGPQQDPSRTRALCPTPGPSSPEQARLCSKGAGWSQSKDWDGDRL